MRAGRDMTQGDAMRDVNVLLDRLSRRGVLTITAEDGSFEVTFKAHGPWINGRCTTDKHDLFDHCRLGAKNWHGDSFDLAALLVLCEMETRPDNNDIDDLAWKIQRRRNSRTYGPPLPTYMRWDGWSPGIERWLRTSDHKHEYRGGYERDLVAERKFDAEQAASEARRKLPKIPA